MLCYNKLLIYYRICSAACPSLVLLIHAASSPSFVKHKLSSHAPPPKVKVINRQIVSESHPVVQQLVDDFDYGLEDAIEAVQLFRNLESAMDYLAMKDAKCDSEGDPVATKTTVITPTPEDK